MDYRDGSLRYDGCPSEKADNFLSSGLRIPFLGSGFARSVVSDTMHGLMFALMPDDGLTLHKWPIVGTLYMLPAREQ